MILKLTEAILKRSYEPVDDKLHCKTITSWDFNDIYINTDQIICIRPASNKKGALINVIGGDQIYVKESPEDILSKI